MLKIDKGLERMARVRSGLGHTDNIEVTQAIPVTSLVKMGFID